MSEEQHDDFVNEMLWTTMAMHRDIAADTTQERPLGGKLDSFFSPSWLTLIKVMLVMADHSPFHAFSFLKLSSFPISGTQNPVANSFASVSMCCDNSSSRLVGGLPLRRSARN